MEQKTIKIPKEKYEELLAKAQKFDELQNQGNSQKVINSMEDLPQDLREEMEMLAESSTEEAAEFFAKHDL